jgi:hypothetical protein
VIQNNASIFDLLLGPMSPDSAATRSSDPIQGGPFGALLQLIMSRQQEPDGGAPVDWQALLHSQANEGQRGTEVLPTPLGLGIGLTPATAVAQPQIPVASSLTPDSERLFDATVQSLSPEQVRVHGMSAADAFDEDVLLSVPEEVRGELSMESIARLTSREVASLLASRGGAVATSQQVPVEAGVYRVLDTTVLADTVEFTVVSEDAPLEVVKISAPLELLDDFAVDVTRPTEQPMKQAAARVALNDTPNQTGDIARLLAQLNIRELRISRNADDGTSNVNNAKTDYVQTGRVDDGKLAIVVTGERQSQIVSVRRELPQESVGARRLVTQRASQHSMPHSEPPENEFLTPMNVARSVVAEDQFRGAVFDPLTRRFSEKTGRMDLVALESDISDETTLPGQQSIQSVDAARVNPDRVPTGGVRFTLPDDIRTALKPDGRALTIMIDPEHLGPARVRLAMREGALTARVTVDTPQARTVVEQSLDQLTAQLQRAGIKVDLIEVNVAGDQPRHQFFERNFGMRGRVRARFFDENDVSVVEGSMAADATRRMRGTIGPRGVNVYA